MHRTGDEVTAAAKGSPKARSAERMSLMSSNIIGCSQCSETTEAGRLPWLLRILRMLKLRDSRFGLAHVKAQEPTAQLA